jgi:periplasmic mercuric ion binding protein
MTKIFFTYLFLTIGFMAYAQDTSRIKTSAMCHSCKNRIESRLAKQKGILSSDLDIESKLLTVVYTKSEWSLEKLEEKITEIGYDANGKPAKKAAYKRLPACCRKDYQGSHN